MYSSQIVFDLFPVPPIPHACMDNVIASMIQSASPQRLDHFIVDVPIPDQDPIGNLQGTRIIIMVRLYFNWARTNNAMTYVPILNVKVRRNEYTLDIGNTFIPTFDF